ncbi:MAG: MurT ligase domain-containing protein [Propionibacteriaceae bacterium]|nr:MurT ligase domain-containing protein [Propionibacteriaceae bacterium]
MTRVAPQAFRHLLAGRRVLAVSGTNGKTTTTHLLAAAVRAADVGDVVSNADGANLSYGIASALSTDRHAPIAVLETDERVVRDMIEYGRPEVLVFLNFSRDQLDRHHEIKSLAKSWRRALEDAGATGPVIVGNATDPLVVWAAQGARKAIWVETATKWNEDSALCPECGAMLQVDDGARPRWYCAECGLRQPEAEYTVAGNAIRLSSGELIDPQLNVPGYFNVSNAACALAAAVEFGISETDAVSGFATVTSPAGRFATAKIGKAQARLILAKNPAGWAEALPLIETDPVVLAIDSVAADGKDVSWLWDVPYEVLRGRNVICAGPRAQDLAVRLSYAEVEHEVVPDLFDAVNYAKQTDVVATYTPFQRYLKLGGLR